MITIIRQESLTRKIWNCTSAGTCCQNMQKTNSTHLPSWTYCLMRQKREWEKLNSSKKKIRNTTKSKNSLPFLILRTNLNIKNILHVNFVRNYVKSWYSDVAIPSLRYEKYLTKFLNPRTYFFLIYWYKKPQDLRYDSVPMRGTLVISNFVIAKT